MSGGPIESKKDEHGRRIFTSDKFRQGLPSRPCQKHYEGYKALRPNHTNDVRVRHIPNKDWPFQPSATHFEQFIARPSHSEAMRLICNNFDRIRPIAIIPTRFHHFRQISKFSTSFHEFSTPLRKFSHFRQISKNSHLWDHFALPTQFTIVKNLISIENPNTHNSCLAFLKIKTGGRQKSLQWFIKFINSPVREECGKHLPVTNI